MLRFEKSNVRWTAGSLILTLAILIWVGFKHYEWKNQASAKRAELRRKGEALTHEEFAKIYPPPSELDEVTLKFDALFKELPEQAPIYNASLVNPVAPGWDAGVWALEDPGIRGISNGWQGLAVEVGRAEPTLAKIRWLLNSNFGSGYVCPTWDSDLSSYLRWRKVYFLLQRALMSNLHQGKFLDAKTNLDAMLALVRFGQEQVTLVSLATRAAEAESAYDATWNVLAATNWSEVDLKRLQSAWSSVGFLNRLPSTQAASLVSKEDIIQKLHSEGPNYLATSMQRGTSSKIKSKNRLAVSAEAKLDFMISTMIEPAASFTGSDRIEASRTKLLAVVKKFQIGSRTIGTLDQSIYEPLYSYCLEYKDDLEMLKGEEWSLTQGRAIIAGKSWRLTLALREEGGGRNQHSYESASVDRFMPEDALGSVAVGNYVKIYDKIFEAETVRQLAITAVAIKRYQLATGHLPSTLDALIPNFLESPPTDYMDGKTLRYHLDGPDKFNLYSVGFNGTDEGGDSSPAEGYQALGQWSGQDLTWWWLAQKPLTRLPRDVDSEIIIPSIVWEEVPAKELIANLFKQMGLRKFYWPFDVDSQLEVRISGRRTDASARAVLDDLLATNHLAAYLAPETTNTVILRPLPGLSQK